MRVFLHVAEGLPNFSHGVRRKYFTGARNSACETSGAADGANAIGALDHATALDIMQRCQNLAKMTRFVIPDGVLSALMR